MHSVLASLTMGSGPYAGGALWLNTERKKVHDTLGTGAATVPTIRNRITKLLPKSPTAQSCAMSVSQKTETTNVVNKR